MKGVLVLNVRHLPSSENQAQDKKNVRPSQKRSARNVREKNTISTFTQGLTTYNLERLVRGRLSDHECTRALDQIDQ